MCGSYSTPRSSQADSRHQKFPEARALAAFLNRCQPLEAALLFKIVKSSGSAWRAESSGIIVVARDLTLNDCDGRTAFCDSERFARGELGGVFNDILRNEFGHGRLLWSRAGFSPQEQDEYEASSTSCWLTWTDAPCCSARVPNFCLLELWVRPRHCRWQRGTDNVDVEDVVDCKPLRGGLQICSPCDSYAFWCTSSLWDATNVGELLLHLLLGDDEDLGPWNTKMFLIPRLTGYCSARQHHRMVV